MISQTAQVDPRASLGEATRVWDLAQVREDASLGSYCVIGRGAYIDHGVVVGDNCKIQNGAMLYAPARIGAGVFIGPGAILTNDMYPRAVNPDLSAKSVGDWEPSGVTIDDGASIGAGAIVRPGVSIGAWATVAAGAMVTASVPAHALIVGVPGRQVGWVGRSGIPLRTDSDGLLVDDKTGDRFREADGNLKQVQP